jgi:hypothetical protein
MKNLSKMLMLSLSTLIGGCAISSGLFVEKDWRVDSPNGAPDLRTRWGVEVKKEIGE